MADLLLTLQRRYTMAALFLLNLLFFFVVGNLAAAILHKVLVAFGATNQVEGKYGRELLRAAYPHLDEEDWRSLLSESHAIPLDYEPFTLFRERPRQGKWVNIHSAGFRLSGAPLPWPVRPSVDTFIVFVFGGSTTFGYGIADHETIPARLQEHLPARLDGRRVLVYNFGRGSYYSSQERILFERLVVAGNVPDLAVFIDGLNDFYYHNDEPEFAAAFSRAMQPQRTKDAWLRISGKLPIVQLIAYLTESDAEKGKTAHEGDIADSELDAVLSRYMNSQKAIRAVASSFGIKTIFVWQPIPNFRYDQRFHPFASAGYAGHKRAHPGYRRMQTLLDRDGLHGDFLDLSGLQEGLQEPLYVDLVHYNPKLCDLIAAAVASRVSERNLSR